MKLFELGYFWNKNFIQVRIWADTRMQARSVIVQENKCQIDFKIQKEVNEGDEWTLYEGSM